MSPMSDAAISVRVPSWCTKAEDVQCVIDGSNNPVGISEGYLQLGRVTQGSKVTLTFSLPESSEKLNIGGVPYELLWRGYDILSLKNLSDYQSLMPRYKGRVNS